MSVGVWLEEDRKFPATVVGLDLLLGLSKERRCSLTRSFKRRFVSPICIADCRGYTESCR